MMDEKRFQVARSRIYGWMVYDRERDMAPAYDACCELLPRIAEGVAESPVNFPNYSQARDLATRLNVAWKRSVQKGGCGEK